MGMACAQRQGCLICLGLSGVGSPDTAERASSMKARSKTKEFAPSDADISADEALALIGDDPHTLELAIQLMDRILANRSSNLTKQRLTR